MSTMQFLDAVLPQQGKRFVVAKKGELLIPRRLDTNQQVITTGQQFDAQDFDVYVAIGGYVEATTISKAGNPIPSRLAEHAQWHRCLRLDLDVQLPNTPDPKKYATKEDAANALLAFVKALNLPRPLVVDSGGGFHVYWPFTRDMLLTDWLPLAARLQGTCELNKLLADSTTTTDAARILRLPGSHNQKAHLTQPEVVLRTPDWDAVDPSVFDVQLPTASTLQQQCVPVVQSAVARAPVTQTELQTPRYQNTQYTLAGVLTECGVMADMVMKHGAGYDYNQWWLALCAVQASIEPPAIKRAVGIGISDGWSKGGKTFNTNDFDQKFNAAATGHPFSCARMASTGAPASAICQQCPYYADNFKSVGITGYNGFQSKRYAPVVAPAQQQAAYTNGATSIGVFVFAGSRVFIQDGRIGTTHFMIDKGQPVVEVNSPNGSGKRKRPILGKNYKLKEVSHTYTSAGRSMAVLVFECGRDGDNTLMADQAAQNSLDRMHDALASAKIIVNRKQADEFRVFMSTFLSELQAVKQTGRSVNQCGWDGEDFVLGLNTYRKGVPDPIKARGSTERLLDEYREAGDRAKWDRAFNIILNSGADRQMMLALGIATPLMAFSQVNAVVIHLLSESGTGKTTTTDMIQSIWGNPKKLRLSIKDTINAQEEQAAATGSLPLVLDELTTLDPKQVVNSVHSFTAGRKKNRLNQNMKVEGSDLFWSFFVFCSSNTSAIGRILENDSTDTGGAARVFEIALSDLTGSSSQRSQDGNMLEEIKSNFGGFGVQLARYYADIGTDVWREAVSKGLAEWNLLLNEGGAGRFHAAVGALAMLGAAIGKQFGYAFDLAAVKAEVLKQAKLQRQMLSEQRKDLNGFVLDYVLDNEAEMMIYRNGQRGFRQQYSRGKCMGEKHENTATNHDRYVVLADDLKDYVKAKKGSWELMVKKLVNHPHIHREMRHFLDNSEASRQWRSCFVIDFTAMARPVRLVSDNTGGQAHAVDQP